MVLYFRKQRIIVLKKMIMNKKFLFLIVLVLGILSLSGQKKLTNVSSVLGKPERFKNPIGFNDSERTRYFIEKIDKASKDPWIVISDRENNPVYERPDGSELNFKLGFKEYFWVIEEKETWIHIVKINPRQNSLKVDKAKEVLDYGWIKKSNMLLWTDGLVSENSGIHQKAFLLNRASNLLDIINSNKDLASIYVSPYGSKTIGEKNIYEFYFILKKENLRSLLCKESKTSINSLEDDIVGWVDNGRMEDWNTRIAMEPNFEKAAFEERKRNKNFRLIGYSSDDDAKLHAENGEPPQTKLVWDNDPVTLSPSVLDEKTHSRFKGTVVRFPMFNKAGEIYRSGVIGNINVRSMQNKLGTIPEIDYGEMQKMAEEVKMNSNNYNILFFVDASSDMEYAKLAISNTINELNGNVQNINYRYAVALYRDVYDKKEGNMLKTLALTKDIDKINGFLSDALFGSAEDFDDYTTIYYNLKSAILESGFNKEHTNIVFVIGRGADYRASFARRVEAKSNNEKTYIEEDDLLKTLSDFNINLSFLQAINKGTEPYRWFLEQAKSIILETAKDQFSKYRNMESIVPDLKLDNPEYNEELDDKSMISLKGGFNQSYIAWPFNNKKMTVEDLTKNLIDISNQIIKHKNKLNNMLTDVFIEGKSFETSAGSLSPEITKILEAAMTKKSLDKDVIKKLLGDKYKLYTEIYFPARISGAEFPTISYVLFMPESELEDYIQQLHKLSIAADLEPSAQREELYNTLVQLTNQYSGNDFNKNNIKNVSLSELSSKMQGLKNEGLGANRLFDFKLGDIKNDRVMKDDKVANFIADIVKKRSELEKIRSLKGKYEFSYTSKDNIYYWIPLELTL